MRAPTMVGAYSSISACPLNVVLADFSPGPTEASMKTNALSFALALLAIAVLAGAGCTGMVDSQTPNCTSGQKACSGQCKTVATDQQNCGACGNACAAG